MKNDNVFIEELPRRHEPPPRFRAAEGFLIAAVAIVLLLPCVWQPHIHAGDLASHSYNAWLAGEIRAGRADGLFLAPVRTNVLADLMLEHLVSAFGRSRAEKLVMGAAVEAFFWGTFLFIGGIYGRKPWLIAPSLAMLSYGLVFHFGFVNFYLSTGISMWLLWLLWKPTFVRLAAAIPLTPLAFLAHPVAVAWAAGVLVYHHVYLRVTDRYRVTLLTGGTGFLLFTRVMLTHFFPALWSLDQIFSLEGLLRITGAEQVWIYGAKYLIVAAGLLLAWGFLLVQRLNQSDPLQDSVFHLWCLNVAAVVVMPRGIQFSPDTFAFLYVPERLSLFVAIFLCAFIGGIYPSKKHTRASLLLAGVYFVAMYVDQQALNQIERKVSALIETIPPRQRVVVAMKDANNLGLNGLVHIGSGPCIGRCFDYANYEPATRQFRVQVRSGNGVVASNMDAVRDLEEGRHVVTPAEAPIYSVCAEPGAQEVVLTIRRHGAGEKTCMVVIPVTLQLPMPW